MIAKTVEWGDQAIRQLRVFFEKKVSSLILSHAPNFVVSFGTVRNYW
jgi:hypothetical protein